MTDHEHYWQWHVLVAAENEFYRACDCGSLQRIEPEFGLTPGQEHRRAEDEARREAVRAKQREANARAKAKREAK